jgi:hypothetical protein
MARIRFRFDKATPGQGVEASDARSLGAELDASTSPAARGAGAKITRALASEATKLTFDAEERTAILDVLGTETSSRSPGLRELYHELQDEGNWQQHQP